MDSHANLYFHFRVPKLQQFCHQVLANSGRKVGLVLRSSKGGMRGPHTTQGILGLPLIIILTLLGQGVSGTCNHEACSTAYVSEKVTQSHTREYCIPLNKYRQCLESTASDCKGSLHYHTDTKVVSKLIEKHKCDDLLSDEELTLKAMNQTELFESLDPPLKNDPCDYTGDSSPSHCVLFGDPHLKTFHGEFMTCRIQKAWPLLSNPYLAVQVTNELVGPELKATATTKVTVIIKGHNQCGAEKTYEASTEALPKAFMDGSTYSGDSRYSPTVSISEEWPGEYAIIYVRYINATIGIRKIERYLTVTVTLPREILEANESEPGDMQLCTEGCPLSERLQPAWGSEQRTAMSQEKALKLCREFKMTDYYLDSCVFDLVTTGDKSFIAAARAAHADLWHHDPRTAYDTLQNCTKWPCQAIYSNSRRIAYEMYALLLTLVTSLFITHWSYDDVRLR